MALLKERVLIFFQIVPCLCIETKLSLLGEIILVKHH
jgi:hypothetical protein